MFSLESTPRLGQRDVYPVPHGRCNNTLTRCVSLVGMKRQPVPTIETVLRLAAAQEWTQARLARELGVSEQRLTNWKRRGMPTDYDRQVAEKLGVGVDVLYGRDDTSSADKATKITADTPEEIALLRFYRMLQHEDGARSALLFIAERLAVHPKKGRGKYPFSSEKKKATKQTAEP